MNSEGGYPREKAVHTLITTNLQLSSIIRLQELILVSGEAETGTSIAAITPGQKTFPYPSSTELLALFLIH